jgi:hypothetical protein
LTAFCKVLAVSACELTSEIPFGLYFSTHGIARPEALTLSGTLIKELDPPSSSESSKSIASLEGGGGREVEEDWRSMSSSSSPIVATNWVELEGVGLLLRVRDGWRQRLSARSWEERGEGIVST